MVRVTHPNAVRDTVDSVDDRVTLRGTTYELDGDTVDVPESAARAWAEQYDLSLDDIRADGDGAAAGTCEVVKQDGDVCGRELPCPYHSDES